MRRAALAVLLLALGVRVAAVAFYPGWDFDSGDMVGDEHEYHVIATNLEAGDGYSTVWLGGGPDHGRIVPTAFRAPLFPSLLAGLYAVTGPSPFAGRLLVLVLDAATCALLVPLGARLIRPAAGVAAGIVAAVYPPLWVNTFRLMSEASFTLVVVAALLAAEWLRRSPSPRRAALLGVTLGVAALGRPNGLLLAVVLSGWAVWIGRPGLPRAVRIGGACLAGTAIVVVPWVVRTAVQVGAVVPITTTAGSVLAGEYSSAMLDRDQPYWGTWDFFLWLEAFEAAPDEVTLDRRLADVGREWIREHPGDALTLVGLHGLRYFDLYWRLDERGYPELVPTAHRGANAAAVVSWWMVAAAAVAGAARLRARRALAPMAPALLAFGAFAVSGLLLAGPTRYRAPAEPVVVLLAVASLVPSPVVRHGAAADGRSSNGPASSAA